MFLPAEGLSLRWYLDIGNHQILWLLPAELGACGTDGTRSSFIAILGYGTRSLQVPGPQFLSALLISP
jgi:hypothetical protein